ncbi:c-type cytochrome [Acidicapsa ligni]|uniref:c-type cytochrome n=1 Tax=Acidicapsa ligni TaxID=542300 RepID=UPI0021DFC373|nr:cytochrome c [Acidicapsa ligni]
MGLQKGTDRTRLRAGAALVFAALAPVGLVLFGIGASGCHHQELTPQQAEGQNLYMTRCAHCHEDNDLMLKPPPPNIHGAMRKNHLPSGAPATDAEIQRLVLAGKNKMPSFAGRFNQEQMAALQAYLHTDMPLTQPE